MQSLPRKYLFETVVTRVKILLVKSNILLATIFITVFAVSRIPGLMPSDFSVAYALMFCAGAFLGGAMAWWLPLAAMLVTDVALNVFYYHSPAVGWYLLINYAIYALLIGLGRLMGRKAPFYRLLLGGVFGAVIFYLVTNTLSWWMDSAYAKTLAGWVQALTVGRPDWHPSTWEMFRNTLLSGGLFTMLFAAVGKLASESPADKTAGAREPGSGDKEPDQAPEPEEAKA